MQHRTTAFPMFLYRKPRDRAYRYEAAIFLYYYAMYILILGKVTDGADDAAELATHILCIMV